MTCEKSKTSLGIKFGRFFPKKCKNHFENQINNISIDQKSLYSNSFTNKNLTNKIESYYGEIIWKNHKNSLSSNSKTKVTLTLINGPDLLEFESE